MTALISLFPSKGDVSYRDGELTVTICSHDHPDTKEVYKIELPYLFAPKITLETGYTGCYEVSLREAGIDEQVIGISIFYQTPGEKKVAREMAQKIYDYMRFHYSRTTFDTVVALLGELEKEAKKDKKLRSILERVKKVISRED